MGREAVRGAEEPTRLAALLLSQTLPPPKLFLKCPLAWLPGDLPAPQRLHAGSLHHNLVTDCSLERS